MQRCSHNSLSDHIAETPVRDFIFKSLNQVRLPLPVSASGLGESAYCYCPQLSNQFPLPQLEQARSSWDSGGGRWVSPSVPKGISGKGKRKSGRGGAISTEGTWREC